MADKKITDDSLLSGASVDPANDVIPIVDVSEASPADRNKKITPNELKIALGISVPDATPSVKGIAKLYSDLSASNTDGAVTQAGVKTVTDAKASLASPTFTGTPAAPTAAVGTSTTQIATTEFVQKELYKTFINAT